MSELGGTVALVTGASSGIGEATALALSAQGAKVALVARRGDRLREVAGRVGDGALVIEADVTDPAQAERAVDADRRGVRPPRHARQQRRRDAPRPDRERPARRSGIAWSRSTSRACCTARTPRCRICSPPPRTHPATVADLVNISSVAGRTGPAWARGVYNLTKHGVGRLQRIAAPGGDRAPRPGLDRSSRAPSTPSCGPTTARRSRRRWRGGSPRWRSCRRSDIADAIVYIVTRPWRMSINEILIRPTEQAD